jgi:hypothetical protein
MKISTALTLILAILCILLLVNQYGNRLFNSKSDDLDKAIENSVAAPEKAVQ